MVQQQKYSTRTYVLGGLFALLAAFPLVTTTALDVPLTGSVTGDTVDRAVHDRGTQSAQRRLRWSVLKDCAQREARGEVNACPDINDSDALIRYWVPAQNDGGMAAAAFSASLEDLREYERHMLRRAVRVGQCPADLDSFVVGFQALCEATVSDDDRLDHVREATEALTTVPSQHYRLKGR